MAGKRKKDTSTWGRSLPAPTRAQRISHMSEVDLALHAEALRDKEDKASQQAFEEVMAELEKRLGETAFFAFCESVGLL